MKLRENSIAASPADTWDKLQHPLDPTKRQVAGKSTGKDASYRHSSECQQFYWCFLVFIVNTYCSRSAVHNHGDSLYVEDFSLVGPCGYWF